MTIAIAVEEAALEHVVDDFLGLCVEGGDEENGEEEFFHGCWFVKGIASVDQIASVGKVFDQ